MQKQSVSANHKASSMQRVFMHTGRGFSVGNLVGVCYDASRAGTERVAARRSRNQICLEFDAGALRAGKARFGLRPPLLFWRWRDGGMKQRRKAIAAAAARKVLRTFSCTMASRRLMGICGESLLDCVAQSKTATASISIRKSGTAKAWTPIQVLAGGFPEEKNSLRALPTASALAG